MQFSSELKGWHEKNWLSFLNITQPNSSFISVFVDLSVGIDHCSFGLLDKYEIIYFLDKLRVCSNFIARFKERI